MHLRLLSTPPYGDAVTFRHRPKNAGLEGTCTPLMLPQPLAPTRPSAFLLSGCTRKRCLSRHACVSWLGGYFFTVFLEV